MSAEKVVRDTEWDVYRIRKADGVIVGTEYGGYPCGWDTRAQAEEQVELRAELHAYYGELRASGFPGLSAWCAR